MDTLQNMRAFSYVAEAGSFTAAAAMLDTTTANVSRAVSNLEAHLQTRLLNRTTRRIALTEAGKRYLQRCEQILAYVEEAEAEASDAHSRPAGQLKVHTMTGIGHHFVIDAIACYRKTHPDVTFDLTLANRVPDLLNEGYDVSIVLASELPDSGFVSQRLGITYSIVCASPDYVKAHGCATKPSDLLNHACLRLVSPVIALDKWVFEGPEGQEMVLINSSPFLVNSADAMRTDGAISVAKTLEGIPLQRRRGVWHLIGHRQAVQRRRSGHAQLVFIDPTAPLNGLQGVTDGLTVANHLAPLRNVHQGDFVALGHEVQCHQTVGKHRAGRHTLVIDDHGHVVARVQSNRAR